MRPLISLSLAITILIQFSSCCFLTQSCGCNNGEAKEFCLDGENLEWAHYQAGEIFEFVNNAEEIKYLEIYNKTKTTHYGLRGDECEPDEYDAVHYEIYFDDRPLINVEIGGSGEMVFIRGQSHLGQCYLYNQSCRQLNSHEFSGQFFEISQINGIDYEKVFLVDLTKELKNVYWSKDYGIISFELDSTKWYLII